MRIGVKKTARCRAADTERRFIESLASSLHSTVNNNSCHVSGVPCDSGSSSIDVVLKGFAQSATPWEKKI